MKYLLNIILFLFCGFMISCDSPTKPNQTLMNDSPVLSVTANSVNMCVGDTLILTIHAENSTLRSGILDFKDSTIIIFDNLKSVLDTTLIHIFKSVGMFNITVSFSNANETTLKQLKVTVNENPPPVITLTVDKTTLVVGDTIKIALHASDPTLTSGSLSLSDGGFISFSNLKPVFDTTIIYVFWRASTNPITATFTDGYTSTVSSIPMTINEYYFVLHLSVGMIWRFSYSLDSDVPPSSTSETQNGIHEWKILSYTVANQDTTFIVQQIRNDTRKYIGSMNNHWVDTTYSINDTLTFTFVQTYNSIQFQWPIQSGLITSVVPNHKYISIYPYEDWNGSGPAKFYDNEGPLGYYEQFNTSHGIFFHETLTRIEFIKP
jgi:hypothetical protein